MARKADNMPARNKKNFRPTKSGAGMTAKGVAEYRKKNPGSKLKTAGKPKAGESERMKKKRASFKARHAANIKRGKLSAAYWADKVKW